jgi:hypothetical protein
MNIIRITKWCALGALVALGTTIGLNQPIFAQEASAAGQEGMEVLTRGPLHEAFAETITFDPEPGVVAPKAPPDDIEELTPEQRPAGENLTWIPGYWAWDDERSDYLWLSGVWRAMPPGRQWVPGYWGQSQQGFQWTSGYWADAEASEIDYLPEPPATIEAGPNIAANSADDIWLPGCWIWQQNRYAWRPGYWTPGHQDWDWVPDHYVWTPSGYVFVDGYYDYSVPRRGVVFAPVYFDRGLRTQSGFSYSPSTVINPGVFVSHLFLRPGSGHYYFGDYYGSNYENAGFSPWFSFHSSRRGYDPIFASQRWQHRNDRGWEQRAEANFQNLRDNEDARPPRTWAAQRALGQRGLGQRGLNQRALGKQALDQQALDQRALDQQGLDQRALDQRALDQRALDQRALDQQGLDQRALDQRALNQRGQGQRALGQRELAGRGDTFNRSDAAVAESLEELAQRKDAQLRFQPVDPAERQQFGQRGQEYRKYLQQRQQLEANAARTPGGDPANAAGPARRQFSRSPFVAQPADQLGENNRPPQRHQVLKPDFQVQPQPRTRGGQTGMRQGFSQGAAGGPQQLQQQQQQDPQARGNVRAQGQQNQLQGQGANQGNRQRASAGQPQGQGGQGQGANRGGNRQGASGGQQQGPSQNQPADEAK